MSQFNYYFKTFCELIESSQSCIGVRSTKQSIQCWSETTSNILFLNRYKIEKDIYSFSMFRNLMK